MRARTRHSPEKPLRFNLSRKAKITINKIVIRPIVMYGGEPWTLTKENSKTLLVWERRILRSIYGVLKEGNRWRIRHNAQQAEMFSKPEIISATKKGKL